MNKQLIYIIGGVAVVGIGYYLYSQNKKKSMALTDGVATGGAVTGGAETGGAETGGGTKAGQNIKDLKGKEKRGFRKDTRDICKEKYGSGADFRECKKRVKSGGVAFDGSDIQDDFYSGMTNDFDISF